MTTHIIIDGYNLIRQSPDLTNQGRQEIWMDREGLVDKLAAYKKLKRHKFTVVFDGTNAPISSNRKEQIKGISIKFSRRGETADTLIKRMAANEKERAIIVTSDREIVDYCVSVGAATISSLDFEEKIAMAQYMNMKGEDLEEDNSGWVPTTKKKGPRRRLPRKERRVRRKIKKL